MQIVMDEALVSVGTGPDGNKVMVAIDKQSGLRVVLPLTEQGAKAIAAALSTGLIVASGPLTPTLTGKGNGGVN